MRSGRKRKKDSNIWEIERLLIVRQVARWTEQMSKYIGNDCIIIIILIIIFIIISLKSHNHHHIHHSIETKIYQLASWAVGQGTFKTYSGSKINLFKELVWNRSENNRWKLKKIFQTPSNYNTSKISGKFLVKDSKLIDIVESENVAPSLEWHLCQQRRLAWKLRHLPPWL